MSEKTESGTWIENDESIERKELDQQEIKQLNRKEVVDQNSDFDDEKEIVSKDDTTTEQIRRYPLMKCSLKIKHLSFPALFDTGSAASLLSMDIFGRIPRNCMKLVENVKTNFVHFQTVEHFMGVLVPF